MKCAARTIDPSLTAINGGFFMRRVLYFVYGIGCYLLFFGTYLWLACFVGSLFLPQTIDTGPRSSLAAALSIDVALLLGFALQHSVMARPAFKRWWTQLVPEPIERSTYVLFSCIVLAGLMLLWQPIGIVIWDVRNPVGWSLLMGFFATGWLLVPLVSLAINHFDLFGVRQVWLHFTGRPYTSLSFRTPAPYNVIRHPLYIGWGIAFWATPTMTLGHLLLAIVWSAYMVAASRVEERDLAMHFGDVYEDYRRRVPAFMPLPRRAASHARSAASQPQR
jgi:protein-S-isoprenylcysteine O-methyltransferase Ste14